LTYGAENIKICGIRVSFPADNNEATTGNGKFLLSKDSVDMDILQPLPIDPPPHDKNYFSDHIKAVANYYRQVSAGKVVVDTINSRIFPEANNGSYQLDREMAYYHPFLKKDSVDIRLNELIYDAVEVADEDVNFSNYDLVVIFHAGLGQIYNIEFDPTPRDIKSAYMGEKDFAEYLGLEDGIPVNDGGYVTDAIILPETQNYIQYDNWEEVFGKIENPAEYQFGLNGTFALMMGFYLGLPSLSDTSGGSGVGKFGLMDQGSANLNSLVPAVPSAWERTYLGWTKPVIIDNYQSKINLSHVEAGDDALILQIPIDSDEYFLVENRCNFLTSKNNLDTLRNREYRANEEKYEESYPSLLPLIKDSIGAKFSSNGVLLSVSRYDLGIPGSGLLIWHIDETIINRHIDDNLVNISKEEHGVDLEEGDGAQDFGYEGPLLGPNVEIGWAFDPWYAGNQGFFELNPEYDSSRDTLGYDRVGFTPYTAPNTANNDYAFSGIYIDSIGPADFTMDFRIRWDRSSGTNLKFDAVEDMEIYDILPVKDSLLVVLSQKIMLFEGDHPLDSADINWDGYEKSTLLFNPERDIIYALGEADNKYQLAAWEMSSSGQIIFKDSLAIGNQKITSNAMLANNSLLFGAETDDGDYLLGYTLTNNELSQSEKIPSPPIQALTGTGGVLYYLSGNTVGAVSLEKDQLQEIVSSDQINQIEGHKLLLGRLNDNKILDLVFFNDHAGGRIGIIKDLGSENIIKTKPYPVIGVSLSEIDNDGRDEILVNAKGGRFEVFNSELIPENNFPVNYDVNLTGEPLGLDSQVLTISENGQLYALSSEGNDSDNFPIATGVNKPDRFCLLKTEDGIAFISARNKSSKLSGKIISSHKIYSPTWYCQGGNSRRNYMPDLAENNGHSDTNEFSLRKAFCWPNPVKSNATNIRYFVLNATKVKVQIYDLAGNFVASLKEDNPVHYEYNELRWQIDNVQSGVYFAVVKATDEAGNSDKKIIKIMVTK